jgi:hypothetical protein
VHVSNFLLAYLRQRIDSPAEACPELLARRTVEDWGYVAERIDAIVQSVGKDDWIARKNLLRDNLQLLQLLAKTANVFGLVREITLAYNVLQACTLTTTESRNKRKHVDIWGGASRSAQRLRSDLVPDRLAECA